MTAKPLLGQVAVITGAGRGIGRMIALLLAEHGADLALVARTGSELSAVQAEIEALGRSALSLPADVSREAEVVDLIAAVIGRFGRLDMVVNNAGIGMFGPLAETSTAAWEAVMGVNVRGTFLMCREAIPYLKQQPRSFIINISSVVGVKGYENQAAYSASKHAVMGLSSALAKEVQVDGIRVHAICPGAVDTGMAGLARPDLDRSILMQPEDIAEIVLFLVTRRGKAVIDEILVRRETSTPWA